MVLLPIWLSFYELIFLLILFRSGPSSSSTESVAVGTVKVAIKASAVQVEDVRAVSSQHNTLCNYLRFTQFILMFLHYDRFVVSP